MHLTRSNRALVAFFTALLLLLCQTAFAAQACAHGFASQAAGNELGAQCHDRANDDPSGSSAATGCEASKALSEDVKVPAFAAVELPVFAVPRADIGLVSQAFGPRITRAVCSSPPLNLLHCRFLV